MKRIVICILCLVVLLCGCANVAPKSDKPTVVTTIFPLYDFARAIGGEKIEVKMLIRPGCEVHSYEPLPTDMMAVYDSDLFLYIGGESDEWVNTLLAGNDINSLALAANAEHMHQEHGHSHIDEHIWTSPDNAAIMLSKICEKIIENDPSNQEFYQKNCDNYIKKIEQVSDKISNIVAQHDNPFILVADRFPFEYFTEYFGIKYEAAFGGCATSTDISLKTMARLTKTIEERNIKSVFCTELSNQNIAKALNEQLGVEIIELHSAHNVTLNDFNNGITYVDILNRNATALERGLNQ